MNDSLSNHRKSRLTKAHLVKCNRLNVRGGKDPEAHVNGVITTADRIKVNLTESDSVWMNVVEPIYGFAKKEFLEVD